MARLLTLVLCFALIAVVSARRQAAASPSSSTHLKFEVVNNCKEKIWPGLLGNPLVEESGFELAPGKSKTIQIPKGWQSGRIWARTGCDSSFQCETGSCGPNLKCEDNNGEAPYSYAEFNLAYSAGEEDYYNVNYADGYNVPITIEP
ncbi:Protein THN-3, partial [Aphelenchoides avenae]